jgi:diaminopimelate decarboxylase
MEFSDTRFHIQNCDLLSLSHKYGTPLYVYDAQSIYDQFQALKTAFSKVENLRINYACKALTSISILRLMKKWGSCVDCVSIEEVKLCLQAGFLPYQIGYTPSGVAWSEIEEAVSLNVKIHLDSLPLMQRFGERFGREVPVGLRLNPHILAGGNFKISTAHERSKFGISIEQLADIQHIMKETGLVVEGLHQHTGSEIKESEVFLKVAELMLETALQFPDLKYLDFGGGFKVPYKPHEIGTDMVEVGDKISARFNAFCEQYGRKIQLVFEPGKFLVAQAGHFLMRVNVVKENPTVRFAAVDSGLNHLIRPMMYDAYHEIVNISKPLTSNNLEQKKYNVVGYICETDTFAENRLLPAVSEGDILCVKNAGAYCFSMSSNYNSRCRPAEVLIFEGKDYLIRQRETFDDILKNQIDIEL